MTDGKALLLFVASLLLILAVLIFHADSSGESSPPQMTIEDAEAVPYVSH